MDLHDILLALVNDWRFWTVLAVALICGIVRGFAGFGTGLIYMPVTAALFGPKFAVASVWIMDSWPTLTIIPKALPNVDWKSVIPAVIGCALTIYLGVLLLLAMDPLLMRWCISVLTIAFVVILALNIRYQGKRPAWLSAIVGGVAGLFSGAAGVPGPPIITYWMASSKGAAVVRANLLIFFGFGEILSGIALFAGNIFTWKTIIAGCAFIPPYLIGLQIGQGMFGLATEITYRRVALAIIVASAIVGLPLLDSLLR